MNKRLIREAEKEKRNRNCSRCANAVPVEIMGRTEFQGKPLGFGCPTMHQADCRDGTLARRCRFWKERT